MTDTVTPTWAAPSRWTAALGRRLLRWWLIPPAYLHPHLRSRIEVTIEESGRVRLFDWHATPERPDQDPHRVMIETTKALIRVSLRRGVPAERLATVLVEELGPAMQALAAGKGAAQPAVPAPAAGKGPQRPPWRPPVGKR